MKAREPKPSHSRRSATALAIATCALALLAFAPPASADIVFGATQGAGAGQTDNPEAIAVDRETGLLYVADRENKRVDVFKVDGSFLRAFGWGVADGTTPALQTCTATCFKGLRGGGAGELSRLTGIAVDNDPASPAHHDVYVTDGARVQRFSTDDNGTPADPADDLAVFERAWGGGVITAGATGSGDLSAGSTTIANVKTSARQFALGQTITAAGKIPADTKIVGLGEGTITLSQPASASGTATTLTAPEGAGHVAVNEVHEVTIEFVGGTSNIYKFNFQTDNPSPTKAETKPFTFAPAIPAATIQAQIEELSNIDPGDVAVSGPAGGPWTVEFKGRYADTDVGGVGVQGGGTIKEVSEKTLQNGASSSALCTAANAGDCAAGVLGKGPGQFAEKLKVAVGAVGAVYVGDDRFKISEGDPSNGSDPRLQTFDPSSVLTKELLATGNSANGLAVDSGGDYYTAGNDDSGVKKYDSAGNLQGTVHPGGNIHAIALDGAGNLYIAQSANAETAVYEYDSAGAPIHTFYGSGTLNSRPLSLAPYSDATGDLFVIEGSSPRRLVHIVTEPPGPVVLPFAAQAGDLPFGFDTKATNVSNLTATLNTRLNPEGKSSTVHFQYVDDASFKKEGGFASAKTVTTSESASLGSDFKEHASSFTIPCAGPGKPGCLAADTVYHFRAVATNADGTDNGPEARFKTLPPISLGPVWATGVGTDSAQLHAALNPNGIDATVHFEYVDDATFMESGFATAQETAPIDFGAGSTELSKSALIYPLSPDTTYHYRYVAEDFFGTFVGPEGALATFPPNGVPKEDCPNQAFRSGASANLPDCRAYELVSPLDKSNGDIVPLKDSTSTVLGFALARIDQATPGGEALTYSSSQAFGDAQSAPWSSQYIARRGPAAGWSSHSVNVPHEGRFLYTGADIYLPFSGFSEDLCSAWFMYGVNFALVPEAPPGVPNLYRRANCGAEGYELLSNVAPPGFGLGIGETASIYYPTIQGFSADGTISAFRAPAKLTPDASSADIYQAYLYREGDLHLISVLPSGQAAATHSSVGTAQETSANKHVHDSVAGAVSADASRVFWSAQIEEPSPPAHFPAGLSARPSRLYLRLNPAQPQSKLSKGKCTEAAKACTLQISAGAAVFRAADPQATRALYTEGKDLYEFDVEKAAKYEAGAATLIAHEVKGLLGASEDATRAYFASEEAIPGAKANQGSETGEAGENNLYLYHKGEGVTFVATLASASGPSGDDFSFAERPVDRSSRVSADGLHAAFMSRAPLTGYDNTDANSGEADAEVFLYDATQGKLVCVSCNPSGALPVGQPLKSVLKEAWAAARIRGWETQWHPSRLLSADGKRLYFDSFEGLVSRDTNGKADVYEWERGQSREECLEEIGGELFVPQSGGCLSLISSGKGGRDAEFIDASASGSDVFFTTEASLLPQDYGLVDIYDAREGGGLPPPSGQPAACEGEACQVVPPPPDDPTPASAGFKGAGNLHRNPQRPCAKGKARRHGRCVAKKHAKKHKRNRQRANHERRAAR